MKSVLLVEDEGSLVQVLTLILSDNVFRVTVAYNGRQALGLLVNAQPDIILTDYMMPVMDGLEMAQAVRTTAKFSTVPILMISSASPESIPRHKFVLNKYLRKPVEIPVLLDAIAELLGDSRRGVYPSERAVDN